jgi:type IV pilus assembly PilX-like protein
MRVARHTERGMALALAIVVLTVVAMLVAAVLLMGTEEARIGENSRVVQRAFAAAEAGVFEVMREWDGEVFESLRIYPVDSIEVTRRPRYTGFVYRLNRDLYFIDVTGRDSTSLRGAATQRVGVLARIRRGAAPAGGFEGLVRGTLRGGSGGGTGGRFWGPVVAQAAVQPGGTPAGSRWYFRLSKYHILNTLERTGAVVMLRSRGWVQLF